jgi:MYXO-CTERM domain-containing protein
MPVACTMDAGVPADAGFADASQPADTGPAQMDAAPAPDVDPIDMGTPQPVDAALPDDAAEPADSGPAAADATAAGDTGGSAGDAAAARDAAATRSDSGRGTLPATRNDGSGCSCSTHQAPDRGFSHLLALLSLALITRRRSRA